ncbi:MAG: hypothetical protein AAF329_02570 [Cyanobacteria bacterium P01_A01_bin.17]
MTVKRENLSTLGTGEQEQAMSLYDIQQNRRIAQTQEDNRQTARHLQESQESVAELQQSVKKLSLTCKALWRLLQATSGLSDRALLETLQNLEQEISGPTNCSQCNRVWQKGKLNCIYCGSGLPQNSQVDHCFHV